MKFFTQNKFAWFVCSLLVVRLYFMSVTGLGDDEAYYWDWSRTLAWSYFDHPPMTAWLIRISTSLFGHTAFSVRFPGMLCLLISCRLVYLLGRDLFDEQIARGAVLLYIVTPLFCLGGLLMVPDSPMGMFWLLTSWLGWKTYTGFTHLSNRTALLLIGLALGLGFLSKYPIVFAALSLLLFFATDTRTRVLFKTKAFWAALVLFFVCCTPVLIWNIQRDWPSFAFHLRDRQTGGWEFTRWLAFIGSQAGLLTPFIWGFGMAAIFKTAQCWRDPRMRFLFLMVSPALLLFGIQPLWSEFKPHWLAPIYPFMFIALSHFYYSQWQAKVYIRKALLPVSFGLCGAIAILFYVNLLTPLVPWVLSQVSTPDVAWDPRQDPASDLLGWHELSIYLKQLQSEQQSITGKMPVLTSWRYQLVAQLAFASQQTVYDLGDRKNHYTLTQDLSRIRGHEVIYVTDHRYKMPPEQIRLQNCKELNNLKFMRKTWTAHEFFVWMCSL